MSRPASLAYQRYQKAISLWPRDKIRPGVQMQDCIQKRLAGRFDAKDAAPDEAAELKQASALFTLLGDGYQKKVRGDSSPSNA
ncbi:hypothetical protein jhhlp_001633 [Lomentospora prolificans]|uniref:Mitochondrial zinc maintenance protein 1, mitochondrial n=1 Tax=Lomentospora prolificans TaxID=41688 RepID=A0A2N3NIS8_9PEZI|nr:hypothetical protein jhhlp_001633 [Lomentospora prolificans]